jgi:hypothetical protein
MTVFLGHTELKWVEAFYKLYKRHVEALEKSLETTTKALELQNRVFKQTLGEEEP